jgi:hypothetical protein
MTILYDVRKAGIILTKEPVPGRAEIFLKIANPIRTATQVPKTDVSYWMAASGQFSKRVRKNRGSTTPHKSAAVSWYRIRPNLSAARSQRLAD